jgi:hypothetical protein
MARLAASTRNTNKLPVFRVLVSFTSSIVELRQSRCANSPAGKRHELNPPIWLPSLPVGWHRVVLRTAFSGTHRRSCGTGGDNSAAASRRSPELRHRTNRPRRARFSVESLGAKRNRRISALAGAAADFVGVARRTARRSQTDRRMARWFGATGLWRAGKHPLATQSSRSESFTPPFNCEWSAARHP